MLLPYNIINSSMFLPQNIINSSMSLPYNSIKSLMFLPYNIINSSIFLPYNIINSSMFLPYHIIKMPKQISVEGHGHCCYRPSSNCETISPLNAMHIAITLNYATTSIHSASPKNGETFATPIVFVLTCCRKTTSNF